MSYTPCQWPCRVSSYGLIVWPSEMAEYEAAMKAFVEGYDAALAFIRHHPGIRCETFERWKLSYQRRAAK